MNKNVVGSFKVDCICSRHFTNCHGHPVGDPILFPWNKGVTQNLRSSSAREKMETTRVPVTVCPQPQPQSLLLTSHKLDLWSSEDYQVIMITVLQMEERLAHELSEYVRKSNLEHLQEKFMITVIFNDDLVGGMYDV